MPLSRGPAISRGLRQTLAKRRKAKIGAARRAHCVAVAALDFALRRRYSAVWAAAAATKAAAAAARTAGMAAAAVADTERVESGVARRLALWRWRQPGPRAAAAAARNAAGAAKDAGWTAIYARRAVATAEGARMRSRELDRAQARDALKRDERAQALPAAPSQIATQAVPSLINDKYNTDSTHFREQSAVPRVDARSVASPSGSSSSSRSGSSTAAPQPTPKSLQPKAGGL